LIVLWAFYVKLVS